MQTNSKAELTEEYDSYRRLYNPRNGTTMAAAALPVEKPELDLDENARLKVEIEELAKTIANKEKTIDYLKGKMSHYVAFAENSIQREDILDDEEDEAAALKKAELEIRKLNEDLIEARVRKLFNGKT